MPNRISHLAEVDPRAQIGDGVDIGPFCVVGPDAVIGDSTILESHVVLQGRVHLGANNRLAAHCYLGADSQGPMSSQISQLTELGSGNVLFPRVTIAGHSIIGDENQFFDNATIGRAPQDAGYKGGPTGVLIGNQNVFRENVTIHRGAEKEDGWTRVGHHNYLMENSHVAHNCRVHSHITMANNVALAGHVHVMDRAIIGGNAAVHQFTTVGTLAFVAGICRVTADVPPYMMIAGTDDVSVVTINSVGLKRNGVGDAAIGHLKKAHRLFYRQHRSLADVRELFAAELGDIIPIELATLLNAIEYQQRGTSGRGREAIRGTPAFEYTPHDEQRAVA